VKLNWEKQKSVKINIMNLSHIAITMEFPFGVPNLRFPPIQVKIKHLTEIPELGNVQYSVQADNCCIS
jgi:hypothetical protein